MNFTYAMPTQIFAAAECLKMHAEALRSLGKKALIVTGARSAKANGSLADAVAALTANGQTYALFDKVMSNPTVQCAFDGAQLCKDEGCDFVLAIGGGSPMDAGKAMALLAARSSDVAPAEIFSTRYTEALPLAAIPTTAGTGSEVTQYAILTNDLAETKTSIATPLIFPRLAFLDAAYMRGLSQSTTINTAVDALSHAIEGMLSVKASVISNTMALQAIRLIASCFAAMQCNAVDDDTREKLLLASTLAGMVIANTGTTIVHGMGYSLTYYKNVDHGKANGLLLPAFLSLVEKRKPEYIRNILPALGMDSVKAFAALLGELLGGGVALSFEECQHYAEKAASSKNLKNCSVVPTKDELFSMFRAL